MYAGATSQFFYQEGVGFEVKGDVGYVNGGVGLMLKEVSELSLKEVSELRLRRCRN